MVISCSVRATTGQLVLICALSASALPLCAKTEAECAVEARAIVAEMRAARTTPMDEATAAVARQAAEQACLSSVARVERRSVQQRPQAGGAVPESPTLLREQAQVESAPQAVAKTEKSKGGFFDSDFFAPFRGSTERSAGIKRLRQRGRQ